MREAVIFTRADVEIEYFTTPWGSPAAWVTVTRPGSWYDGHVYGLRSAKGLEYATTKADRQYLVDRVRDKSGGPEALGDFLGGYGTEDLEEAIGLLVAGLAKWDNDQRDRAAIEQSLASLRDILGEMDEWDPIRTDATLRSRWPEARQLFLQVEMGLFEPPAPTAVPDPPVWPWHSRVALLDVPSADGRTMRSGGTYELRNGRCPLYESAENGGMGKMVGIIHHLHTDLREDRERFLWAYGTSTSADIARQLTSGQLFASIGLQGEPEYELGEIYWRGGVVDYAIALPAGQHPWQL